MNKRNFGHVKIKISRLKKSLEKCNQKNAIEGLGLEMQALGGGGRAGREGVQTTRLSRVDWGGGGD